MPAQLDTLYVLHPCDDVVVATVGHQTPSHAGCSWNAVRTVLGILVVHNSNIRHIGALQLLAPGSYAVIVHTKISVTEIQSWTCYQTGYTGV